MNYFRALPILGLISALSTAGFLQAQTEAPPEDTDGSPYHQALLHYKGSDYAAARASIETAAKEQPDDPPIEMLKARILTELHDYDGARKTLEGLNGKTTMTPAYEQARSLAFGDLSLCRHDFDGATKFYEWLLSTKPGDPDLMLKLIYARVSAGDLIAAGKYASQLKPLDPDHPAYYFAKAALARNAGNSVDEEQNIETVRTIYGITVTNRYLKTYLQVFSSDKNSVSSALNPPAATVTEPPAVPAKP